MRGVAGGRLKTRHGRPLGLALQRANVEFFLPLRAAVPDPVLRRCCPVWLCGHHVGTRPKQCFAVYTRVRWYPDG